MLADDGRRQYFSSEASAQSARPATEIFVVPKADDSICRRAEAAHAYRRPQSSNDNRTHRHRRARARFAADDSRKHKAHSTSACKAARLRPVRIALGRRNAERLGCSCRSCGNKSERRHKLQIAGSPTETLAARRLFAPTIAVELVGRVFALGDPVASAARRYALLRFYARKLVWFAHGCKRGANRRPNFSARVRASDTTHDNSARPPAIRLIMNASGKRRTFYGGRRLALLRTTVARKRRLLEKLLARVLTKNAFDQSLLVLIIKADGCKPAQNRLFILSAVFGARILS